MKPAEKSVILAIFILNISILTSAHYMHYYPNETALRYCEQRALEGRSPCCQNRDDDCSMPIAGTLCYCDDFCDRHVNGDCCPDYLPFCRRKEFTAESDYLVKPCEIGTTKFNPGHSIKNNCNLW